MYRYELGIVDTRSIIKTLKEDFNYDFKNYALTFFKRRVENIIRLYNLKDAEGFLRKLKSDKEFIEIFLKEICIENTEMFRDPSMWRVLREELLPKLLANTSSFKIWFPEVSSGEELFSLNILLKQLNFLDKVRIFASSISTKKIEDIKNGKFLARKIEVNDANYKRIFSQGELSDYYKVDGDFGYWDTDLVKNVEFKVDKISFDDYPKGVKLIIFRNHMIYFNQILQERCMKMLNNSMVPGGHLIIGNNEKIDYWNSDKDYVLVNAGESIYKKKLT